MTEQEKIQRMLEILRSHDIKMSVGGCGCCGSPWVSFTYKGEDILEGEIEYANFDMYKIIQGANKIG